MSDTGQKTFIVATRTENGATVPVKESITEGTTAEVRVRGLGDDRALVDISVDLRSANANPTETARPVQVHVLSGRAIQAGQLGEKITTDFAAGEGRIEALVTRLTNETHPGQVEQ